jgi:predicted TIM-barrel fold metal-dependent hydrolase
MIRQHPPNPSAGIHRRRFLEESIGLAAGAAASSLSSSWVHGADAGRGPIIDTHVHFYDPTRPEGVPWPGPADALLYRPVLPDDWERRVVPFGPAGVIVVEASPWVEDNQWLLDLAERHAATLRGGMLGIVGVVGSLPLEDEASASLIDRFAKQRRFRGIRVNGDKLLTGLDDKGYVDRLARFNDHGLTLDVNGGKVFDAVETVAKRFPTLRVVLNHMGNTPITKAGPRPEWLAAIDTVSQRPNVFMKVSALVENAAYSMKLPTAPVDPAFYQPWLDAAWKAFGNERLMYGSNWPVSDRGGTYTDMFAITQPYVQARGAGAERWFYSESSQAAYRWA